MSSLRVRLFGGVHLWRNGTPLPAFPTQRARSLFVYLALNRSHSHSREVLVGTLWGDEPEAAARRALRTAIWRARSVVDRDAGDGANALMVKGQEVGFNADGGHWIDVAEFEAFLSRARVAGQAGATDQKVESLRAAIELYRGDALDGMYEEWCLYERERLRLMYVGALESLFQAEQHRQDWTSAIAVGQRLLRAEPLREHVHRDLMSCHLEQGNRPAAVRQYQECVRVLEMELGIEPMEETTALYERIRAARGLKMAATPASHAEEPTLRRVHRLLANVDEALESLHGIRSHLEDSRAQLREIVSAAGERRDPEDKPGTFL